MSKEHNHDHGVLCLIYVEKLMLYLQNSKFVVIYRPFLWRAWFDILKRPILNSEQTAELDLHTLLPLPLKHCARTHFALFAQVCALWYGAPHLKINYYMSI